MRLLVLYQAQTPATDHPGYFDGFERMVAGGQLASHGAIGYLGVAQHRGWNALWAEARDAAIHADAIFLQFFHAPMPDPTAGIRALRDLPHHPLIFSSLGDPFGRWTHRVPHSMKVASALSDVTFLTGMGYVARQLAEAGGRNLVLMPHGCCQVRFAQPLRFPEEPPEFDVCFIGSRMRARNPMGHFFRTARRRDHFVKVFTRRYGNRFALFGHGWEGNPCWLGPVPFAGQHQAYCRSAVVVAGTPNANYEYYSSDRNFIALASGVPLVDWCVPGLDRILADGRDCWLAHDIADMVRLCDTLLEMPVEGRQRMAAETRARILGAHTQYHRCRQMIDIVEHLRRARQVGNPAKLPQLPFLVDYAQSDKAPEAVMAWQG